jgi:nucleotide-binding universal stress UspA family protein
MIAPVYRSIVVGTDGSETAQHAVAAAADLARLAGAALELVSAYEPVNPREDIDATLADAVERLEGSGLVVRTHSRQGDPADAILDVAEEQDADLIVVGNKGMTGARRFLLGSVPNKISHYAPCSVLIVRTAEAG